MVSVKILGTGCAKCQKLYDAAAAVISSSGVEADLVKVEDIDKIMDYGVMMTPALVIDEQVKSSGKLPSNDKIATWLTSAATG